MRVLCKRESNPTLPLRSNCTETDAHRIHCITLHYTDHSRISLLDSTAAKRRAIITPYQKALEL